MRVVLTAFAGWVLPIVLSVCLVSIRLFGDQIGEVEGGLMPVVSQIEDVTITSADGGIVISGNATKMRDCDWRKTVFSLGDRSGGNIILTETPHKDKPTVNGPGVLHWDNISVPISRDRMGGVFADAYHQCGWRPWLTISKFYN